MLDDSNCLPAKSIDPLLHRALSKCRHRHMAANALEHLAQAAVVTCAAYIASTILAALTSGVTPTVTIILASCALAGILASTLWRLSRSPYSELDAARLVDLRLGLRERLSSALELGLTDSPFSSLLVEDARGFTPLVKPKDVYPIRWPRRALLAMGGLMLATAVTFLPYGASLGNRGESQVNTKMASEGYRLLEEAQRVTANAQAIGDEHLQQVGEELTKTARKMTERFSSERQVQRSLQKLSKALEDINQQEMARTASLSEAGSALEEAYSQLAGGQQKGAALRQQMRDAMQQAAAATRDPNLSKRLNDAAASPGGPSDSDVLEGMQGVQEESAQAQSRQSAVGQALDSISQSMSSLGYERPTSGNSQQQPEQRPQGQEPGSQGTDGSKPSSGAQPAQPTEQKRTGIGEAPSQEQGTDQQAGQEEREGGKLAQSGDDTASAAPPTSELGSNGETDTKGAHAPTLGSVQQLRTGTGDMQRLTGQQGRGAATSTTVTSGATARGAGADTYGADTGAASFGGPGRAQESAGLQERIPAAYRRIVAGYFDRRK